MKDKEKFIPDAELKLMDQVREVLQHYQYSYSTEKIYCRWIIQYIKFFNSQKYSSDMKGREIEIFLNHLSFDKKASIATQKQAMNALFFLYQKVLDKKVPEKPRLIKLKRTKPLPQVLSKAELFKLFSKMRGNHLLMAKLLYGSGLRLMECIRLRIQDIDFSNDKIHIRSTRNRKERSVMLPGSIKDEMIIHKEKTREIHKKDLKKGYGSIDLPGTIPVKLDILVKSFGYQYLFGAKKTSKDPRSGKIRRYHVIESGLQKAVKRAGERAGIQTAVTCQVLRNCFATHMLENGESIKTVQKLMGHANLKMTKIYLKVMENAPPAIKSPLDSLEEICKE